MLFAVELFDVVARLVVLTEVVLLLLLVKDGIIVPRKSSLGGRVVNRALQNVDCGPNNERASEPRPQRHAPGASVTRTFVNSVGDDVEGSGFGDGWHWEKVLFGVKGEL
jgi:hypothetical protein